jgi:alpha-L-fucosidase 2
MSITLAALGRELKDVEFAKPNGVSLTLDASLPDSGPLRGAVILVHGGGWEAGDKRTYIRPWFETLTGAGIPWFTINYRLGPQSKHPGAVEDIEAAVRWVRGKATEFHIDPSRLVLMGESAGGHLAALAALRGRVPVAGLVSFYGIHDVPLWVEQRGEIPVNISKYLADVSAAGLREASPVTYVKRGQPPMLLIHGTADTGVPWKQSERLCEAARRVGAACEMFLVEGAPHGVENWEKDPRFHVWKAKVVEWLTGVLGGG